LILQDFGTSNQNIIDMDKSFLKQCLWFSLIILSISILGCQNSKEEQSLTKQGEWFAVDSIKVEMIGDIIPIDYLPSKDWYLAANFGRNSLFIFDGSGKVQKEFLREEGGPNDWGYTAGSGFFRDSLILIQGNGKGIMLFDFEGKRVGDIALPFIPQFGSWDQDKKFFMVNDHKMLIDFSGRHDFMEQNRGGYPFPLFEYIDLVNNKAEPVVTLPRSSKYATPERMQMLYYAFTYWNSQVILAPENDTKLYVYSLTNDEFEFTKEINLPIKGFVEEPENADGTIGSDKIMEGEIEKLIPVNDKLFVFYFSGMDENKMNSLGLSDDYWKNLEYKSHKVMVLDKDFNVLDDLELPEYIHRARFSNSKGQIFFPKNIYKMGEEDDGSWFYLMEYR